MLALVAGVGVGVVLGLMSDGGREGRPVEGVAGVPLRVSPESVSTVAVEDEVAVWSSPNALVLVVNADGMEMRALNESQVRALARKPGCEFTLTPDAVMWVSEVSDDPQWFDVLTDF